jgi:hypothetical protein
MLNRTRTSTLDAFGLRDQRNRIYPALTGSDGSTLSLDFTSMSGLDSRFTYTRNSIATFINSRGLVEQVTAAATNDPTKARFDYDPTTLAPRGLLLEGSATNELTNSETFGTGWTDTNITRNSTNNTSPANDLTALRVTASAANATIIRSAAMGTSAQRTLSVWLRRVSGTGNIQFTTNNGTAWTTQAITSSWVRYTFTATTEAQRVGFRIVTSGDSIELWGAQLEAGSVASSYIPSGTSAGQRAADSCHITPLTPWFNATEGTVLHESAVLFPASGFTRVYGLVQQTSTPLGVNTDSISLGLQGSTGQLFLNVREASTDRVNLFVPAGGAITSGTFHKVAVCYKRGDYRISRAGFSATDAYSATFPAGLQSLGFNNISANWPAVWFKSVKYFPTRLPNSQMDAWSA